MAESWYIWLTGPSLIPSEQYAILRAISWFFVTLALTPIVPIALLVIYDFALWVWRLAVANPHSKLLEHPQAPKLTTNGSTSIRAGVKNTG